MKEDGSAFFWSGDTAWNLFHKLSREETEYYFKNRVGYGFNVIQAVVLSEFDGLTTTNAYGRLPLLKDETGSFNPCLPDTDGEYSYWDHIDYVINKAEEYGLYIALLPTWGDKYNLKWGKGPVIFNETNSYMYGKWIAERYKNNTNIIWVLGGDRPLEIGKHYDVIRAMAKGIKEGDGGRHLITFHPSGQTSSSDFLMYEDWLDFNMIQSGHCELNYPNYEKVLKDYNSCDLKPVLDGEPRYEDHPINFKPENGYFDDFDIRQGAYWAVLSGAFGHTYGHHSIWSMNTENTDYIIMNWKVALDRPGSMQMKYLKTLIESKPFFERVPDQSMIVNNYPGANYMVASRGEDYAFVYSPCGLDFELKLGILKGKSLVVNWFNPKTGEYTYIGCIENEGVHKFSPPASGRGEDWVLVMDKAD